MFGEVDVEEVPAEIGGQHRMVRGRVATPFVSPAAMMEQAHAQDAQSQPAVQFGGTEEVDVLVQDAQTGQLRSVPRASRRRSSIATT